MPEVFDRKAEEGHGEPEQPVDRQSVLFASVFPPEKQRAILEALSSKAVDGDVRAAGFLFDRLYGRPGASRQLPSHESVATEEYDLSALSDTEFTTLAYLLEKCSPESGTCAEAPDSDV